MKRNIHKANAQLIVRCTYSDDDYDEVSVDYHSLADTIFMFERNAVGRRGKIVSIFISDPYNRIYYEVVLPYLGIPFK